MATIPGSPTDDSQYEWGDSPSEKGRRNKTAIDMIERPRRERRCFGSRPRSNPISQKEIISCERLNLDGLEPPFCSSWSRRTSDSSISTTSSIPPSLSQSNSILDPIPSSSSGSRRECPPLRPSKKNHRRSLSLCPPAIPRPDRIKRASTSSNGTAISSGTDDPSLSKENLTEFGDSLSPVQHRRIVRAKRRNSMSCSGLSMHKSGSMTAFSSRMGNSLSSLSNTNHRRPATAQLCRRNSISSFPSQRPSFEDSRGFDEEWMNQLSFGGQESPPEMRRMERFDSDLTDASSPGTQSISASVCSSRKRGMSEEPSEEPDDASSIYSTSGFAAPRTSYANNIASRSCQVKPLSPRPPTLSMDQETISYVPIEPTSSTKNAYYEARKRHVTDYLSDSSSDEESVDSMLEEPDVDEHQDKSDSSLSVPGSRGSVPTVATTEEEVLETMTSIEDVKYLITKLRMRQRGPSKSCTVLLPQKWLAEHRRNFIEWAESKLGFTVRHSDPTTSYLEILRPRALSNLDLLESASDMYTAKQHKEKAAGRKAKGFAAKKPPIILDAASSMVSGEKEKPSRVVVRSFDRSYGDVTDNIMTHMDSLSLKERDVDVPLVRHVTIEGNDHTLRPPLFEPGLSPPMEAPPRLSLDSFACADTDLDFIFNGHSPAGLPSRRPPKMSIGSVSTCSIPRRMDITPLNTSSAVQPAAFDFVTTPLMKQTTWGSRPIEGKDWGCSEACDKGTLEALRNLCERSCAEAGVSQMSPDMGNRNANLQLDLDVEAGSEDEYDDDDSETTEETDGFTMMEKDGNCGGILHALENGDRTLREIRRRNSSLKKHKRMSVCLTGTRRSYIYQRRPVFDSRQSLSCIADKKDLSTGVNCFMPQVRRHERLDNEQPLIEMIAEEGVLTKVFAFLEGSELLMSVSLVCSSWADASTDAYAQLMIASVGCTDDEDDVSPREEGYEIVSSQAENPVAKSMERSWRYLMDSFPFASFLSAGSFKRVFKVKNAAMKAAEAISIMDVDLLEESGQKEVVATELAVSAMLSSLTRRGICPNFVVTRGVFTCPFEPPASHWGSEDDKNHQVHVETPKGKRRPRQPAAKHKGCFQYIRQELCNKGDAEEYIKEQPKELLPMEMSRILLFQIAFALHAAASKYCLKHYDLKLLNVFLQDATDVPGSKASATGDIVLRYGLGSKNFALRMPSTKALLAKVADYGTADVKSETNGQPVRIAQFTTFENTPPDFLILGDAAKQGHEHDLFGLGLCMLHLFTGSAPYEEIMEKVMCPEYLKELLRAIWEDENSTGYSVVRSAIMDDVFKDDQGNIIEGEPDEILYDTLYRFLVLFGIPEHKFQQKKCGKVWKAISLALVDRATKCGLSASKQYKRDKDKFSLFTGTNKYIARARQSLESTEGGMELLTSLVHFDPDVRATALDVLNSDFFSPLMEQPGTAYTKCDDVRSYTAFSTI